MARLDRDLASFWKGKRSGKDADAEDYEDIVRASVAVKSDRQRKKWRVGKGADVKVFVDLIGNRQIDSPKRNLLNRRYGL